MEDLSQDVSESAISENTNTLLGRQEVVSLLRYINEEYYYWDKVKVLPFPHGVDPNDIWGIVKLRRTIEPQILQFGNYRFHWNINNKLLKLLHVLDMNVSRSPDSQNRISAEDKKRYLVSSVMEEAIASGQLAGSATARKKAKEMLRQNKRPADISDQVIVNTYATIKKIIEIKSEPLTKENLLELHKLIITDTLSTTAKESTLRGDNEKNITDISSGDVVHTPPDFRELNDLISALCILFNDQDTGTFIPPLVKASIIHFMVGFIHPFTDGNGRIARALSYWYLLKKGYLLTEYLSVSRPMLRAKAQYAKAFQHTEIDDRDLTYFILFNLKILNQSVDELKTYIQRKNNENSGAAAVIGTGGISYRQSLVIQWFQKEPGLLLTIKEMQNKFAISNGSARNDLHDLHQKGILQLRQINKVKAGFVKSANFDTMLQMYKNDLQN